MLAARNIILSHALPPGPNSALPQQPQPPNATTYQSNELCPAPGTPGAKVSCPAGKVLRLAADKALCDGLCDAKDAESCC